MSHYHKEREEFYNESTPEKTTESTEAQSATVSDERQLVASCIDFVADQLEVLPTHEHNDPVLKRMEADMQTFIWMTQARLDKLTLNNRK